jgi:hypothetical protein
MHTQETGTHPAERGLGRGAKRKEMCVKQMRFAAQQELMIRRLEDKHPARIMLHNSDHSPGGLRAHAHGPVDVSIE